MPGTPDADHLVSIAEIEAARERLFGRIHRTPMMISTIAANWVTVASGVHLGDDRLYLKPEHLPTAQPE